MKITCKEYPDLDHCPKIKLLREDAALGSERQLAQAIARKCKGCRNLDEVDGGYNL